MSRRHATDGLKSPDSGPDLSVVSLFAGAGGMDVGLARAGWRSVVATDIDKTCMATLRASKDASLSVQGHQDHHHLEGTKLLQADVLDLTRSDLTPANASNDWRPTLLAGGPPCQPWSSAGLQKGLTDPRGELLLHMVRLTDELKPRFVLFENVRGLVTAVGPNGRPGEVLLLIKDAFEDLGYATTFATLNSADFGSAQRRVRLYMLASLTQELPEFPRPTHARHVAESTLKPWVSLGELLAGFGAPAADEIVRPTERRAPELAALKPGTGVRTGGRIENNRPGGHWGYRQDCFLADPSVPARTVRAASTPDWIRLADGTHRRLTWRECAALQGFPRDWKFEGTVAAKFRQIGNAVQADTVEALGQAIRRSAEAPALREPPKSDPLPAEFGKRVKYTEAEHRTNGEHRVRVRAAVP